MIDPIISKLLENSPWLAVLGFAIYITWKLSKYHEKVENTRETVTKLPCEEHRKTLEGFQAVQTTVDSINEQVVLISKWIMHNDDDMIDALSKKCSPRVMTYLGRSLFDVCGAKKAIDENIDFLISKMDEKDNPTAFDVENNALDVLLGNLSHPMFNPIKEYLYYQPEEITLKDEDENDKQIKLTLMSIVQLMGLELRDRYLALHPDLSKPKE